MRKLKILFFNNKYKINFYWKNGNLKFKTNKLKKIYHCKGGDQRKWEHWVGGCGG
jgi:hypothetical protein